MKTITYDNNKYTLIQYKGYRRHMNIIQETTLNDIYKQLRGIEHTARYILYQIDTKTKTVTNTFSNFKKENITYNSHNEETPVISCKNEEGKTYYIESTEKNEKTKKTILGHIPPQTKITIKSIETGNTITEIKQNELINYLKKHDYTKIYLSIKNKYYAHIVKTNPDEYKITSTDNETLSLHYIDDTTKIQIITLSPKRERTHTNYNVEIWKRNKD